MRQFMLNQQPSNSLQDLKTAFEQFSISSARLEMRYESLRQEAEELRSKLKEKEEEIKKHARLATLGETAAALAHEVRNPLGAIKLFLSMLREDLKQNNSALVLVDNIDQSISTLDNVVSNILAFAKDSKLIRVPTNINSIIQELYVHFSQLLKVDGARISLDLKANPFINAHEQGLRQVLYNLILNACQITKFNLQLTISTRDCEAGVEIVVADNGPGVATDLKQTLFEPFVTGRNEGTGLGLAIVKKIIDQHAGQIFVENNNGAVFTIRLPRK